jgi:hypothetical protein
MAGERKITIIHWMHINYDDDRVPLTIRSAQLHREFADWLEEVGPLNVQEVGDVGLASGSVKWRRIP